MPAFETTMSSPPYASTVAELRSSTEASEVTSRAEPQTAGRPRDRRGLLGDPAGADGVEVGHDDVGALASKPPGHRPSDPARAPR